VEEARVIVTQHHEYTNTSLKEQLAETITTNTQVWAVAMDFEKKTYNPIHQFIVNYVTSRIIKSFQYRDEIEAIRYALLRREEVIAALEEELQSLKGGPSSISLHTNGVMAGPASEGGEASEDGKGRSVFNYMIFLYHVEKKMG